MSIFIKILTIVGSLVVLGLWPLFSKFIDNTIQSRFIDQITPNGWFFISVAFFVIILNAVVIIMDDNANSAQQEGLKQKLTEVQQKLSDVRGELTDIKSAIEKTGGMYDSVTNTVLNMPTNINSGDGGFLLQGGENVIIAGVHIEQNSPVKSIFLEGQFMKTLDSAAQKYNIKIKEVYIGIIPNTNGEIARADIERTLIKNGYKIIERGEAERKNPYGITVQLFNERFLITIGNVPH